MMTTPFFDDILQEPSVLRDLIANYRRGEGRDRLNALHQPQRILLTGMGASYRASLYGAALFGSLGIPATAIEATELLNFGTPLLATVDLVIFISQSGASGEVHPLLAQLPASTILAAITNDLNSPLAGGAAHAFPQHAGVETTVASKTYINSLACLYLLAHQWQGRAEAAFDQLAQLADAAQAIIEQREAVTASWFEALNERQPLVFIGHGPHVPTARQSAMMLAEWAKYPALCLGIGAFRHGFIEFVTPKAGIVVYGEGGSTRASVRGLVDELRGYGASVLSVVNGTISDGSAGQSDDFLAPLLDVIPAQLFAEYMARHFNIEPGFRYIQKVVRQL
jgi:glutamine---fructose-6-phosphate transaminase (isomerizing)